jgi:hypothetical protein
MTQDQPRRAISLRPLASHVVGQAETTILVDTNAVPTSGPLFYRVGVLE